MNYYRFLKKFKIKNNRNDDMEFIRLPMSTKKSIPARFDALDPDKYYKPSEELGNYQWYFFSQKIVSIEDFEIAAEKMDPKIVKKTPRLSFITAKVIPFKEFRSFLIMNYKGWAPHAKGMSGERVVEYTNKLIESFLSCSPKDAEYVKFDLNDESCFAEIGLYDIPMLVSGVIGIVDTENMEYFKLIIGGYDSYNVNCHNEISKNEVSAIKFCPIRKIPIEFNAFNPVCMNEGYLEELGNYGWYLYQYRLKDGVVTIDQLKKNELFRTSIPPVGKFQRSSVIPFKEFRSFLIMNYKGWGPYAKGMNEEKAIEYSDKLINFFLSCPLEEALYIKYEGWREIEDPYLVNGVICVWDQNNKEFFELIMGGTD